MEIGSENTKPCTKKKIPAVGWRRTWKGISKKGRMLEGMPRRQQKWEKREEEEREKDEVNSKHFSFAFLVAVPEVNVFEVYYDSEVGDDASVFDVSEVVPAPARVFDRSVFLDVECDFPAVLSSMSQLNPSVSQILLCEARFQRYHVFVRTAKESKDAHRKAARQGCDGISQEEAHAAKFPVCEAERRHQLETHRCKYDRPGPTHQRNHQWKRRRWRWKTANYTWISRQVIVGLRAKERLSTKW